MTSIDNKKKERSLNFYYDAAGNRVKKIDGKDKATYYVRDAQGNVMAVYEKEKPNKDVFVQSFYIYGSSRIGEVDTAVNMQTATVSTTSFSRIRGIKRYEMSNHLGNVMVVVSDRKVYDGSVFKADLVSTTDYYAFGMVMSDRSWNTEGYRFGFNGKENDNEVKGTGNSLDFGERIYDSRLGLFISIDPAFKKYPFMSPYVFSGNDPIRFIDIFGMGPGDRVKKANSYEGTKYLQQEEDNKTGNLRTANTSQALKYLDCSELVCRVLAEDGLTPKIQTMNTEALLVFFDNKGWHKSDVPKVGDVFLWRTEKGGHTGIVTSISEDGKKVIISHAKGKDYGTLRDEEKKVTYFTGMDGWKGFFRPSSENNGDKATESDKKEDSWLSKMKHSMSDWYNETAKTIDNWWSSGSKPSHTIDATKLNVRSEADKQSKVNTVLNKGDTVKETGKTKGTWIEIKTQTGQTGWVNSSYLKKI